jgi:hypothetical protein
VCFAAAAAAAQSKQQEQQQTHPEIQQHPYPARLGVEELFVASKFFKVFKIYV